MKLVQTLVVRDEVDIVDDQIAYHLNAGVDFVIASDHQSVDGTTDVLERYVREGHLRRIAVEGEMRDGPWRTHMARLAAVEHGADWILTRTLTSSGCPVARRSRSSSPRCRPLTVSSSP